MRTAVKSLAGIVLLVAMAYAAKAQTTFPIDASTQLVSYKQAYKLNTAIADDDMYFIAQDWFNEKPAQFTQKNVEPPMDPEKAKKNKNKIEIDKTFDNSKPIKALDPGGRKIVGRGLLEYYGENTKAIRLLYLDYDIYVQVDNHQMEITITNFRYYHFNPNNYSKTGVYSFEGGTPCEAMDHLEYLVKCQNTKEEFAALSAYTGSEVKKLFASLKTYLSAKNALYIAPSPMAVAKVTSGKTGVTLKTGTTKAVAPKASTGAKTATAAKPSTGATKTGTTVSSAAKPTTAPASKPATGVKSATGNTAPKATTTAPVKKN